MEADVLCAAEVLPDAGAVRGHAALLPALQHPLLEGELRAWAGGGQGRSTEGSKQEAVAERAGLSVPDAGQAGS